MIEALPDEPPLIWRDCVSLLQDFVRFGSNVLAQIRHTRGEEHRLVATGESV